METLITKVETIEQQAQELVSKVRTEGEEKLRELTSAEESLLGEVKARAERKAESIIKDRTKKAQDAVNTAHQDDSTVTASVHSTAEKNREHAITLALSLFTKEYLA